MYWRDRSPLFSLSKTCSIDNTSIPQELLRVKSMVDKLFYESIPKEEKFQFLSFLWETVPYIWENGAQHVKLTASSVLGYIIMKLSPFYYIDLMKSLQESVIIISSGSFLLLSSFAYLTRYFLEDELKIIIEETPLLHLFQFDDSERIISIVKSLQNMPSMFYKTLVEFLVSLSMKNPMNRHIPKAITSIVSKNPSNYCSYISNSLPMFIIIAFIDGGAQINDERFLDDTKRAVMPLVFDKCDSINEYEQACFIINYMVSIGFIKAKEIMDLVDNDVVKNSKSISALLSLPISPIVIQSLYTYFPPQINHIPTVNVFAFNEYSTESSPLVPIEEANKENSQPNKIDYSEHNSNKFYDFGSIECDSQYVLPLLSFFSRDPLFINELVALLSKTIDPSRSEFPSSLKILSTVSKSISVDQLNSLLFKVFSIDTQNWINQFWTLKLIGTLDFESLTKPLFQKALELIELASISKSDKLRMEAKKIATIIHDNMKIESFKGFIDNYIRRIDIFNSYEFELRLSFISYVFLYRTGGWTLSFLHIASLVSESVSVFDFSQLMLEDIFYILSVFSSNLRQPPTTLLFVQHAIGVIVSSYLAFSGIPIEVPKTDLFNSRISHSITIDSIETDVITCQTFSHVDITKCAKAAVVFLNRVQWAEMFLPSTEIEALIKFSELIFPLYGDDSNQIVISLLDAGEISIEPIKAYIYFAIKHSNSNDRVLSIIQIMCISHERFQLDFLEFDSKFLLDYLLSHLDEFSNISFLTVLSMKNFLSYYNINISDEIFNKMVNPREKHLLYSASLSQKLMNLPIINEMPEALDQIKLSELQSDSSSDSESDDEQSFSSTDSINLPPSSFSMEEKSTEYEYSDVSAFISSITPFVAGKHQIPTEVLTSSHIISLMSFSRARISQSQVYCFLESAMSQNSLRAISSVLRYCVHNKIFYPPEKIICCECCHNRRFLPLLFQILSMKWKRYCDLPNIVYSFITTMTSSDLVSFVFDSSTNRKLAVSLIRFEPSFFLRSFDEMDHFKSKEIESFLIFFQYIQFNIENSIHFISKVIDLTKNSHKKRKLALRLLLLFVQYRIEKNEKISAFASSFLNKTISEREKSKDGSYEQKDVELLELAHLCIVLKGCKEAKKSSSIISIFMGKNTPFFNFISFFSSSPSLDDYKTVSESSFSSVSYLPFQFLSSELKKNSSYIVSKEMIDIIFKPHRYPTPIFYYELFTFLSFLLTKNQRKLILSEGFNYWIKNVSLHPSSSTIHQTMLIIKVSHGLLSSKSSEIAKMISLFGPLFEYPIVPNSSIESLLLLSIRIKDPQFALSIITPHIRIFQSYSTHSISESLSVFSLKHIDYFDNNLVTIVPLSKSFFPVFYASVSIMKLKQGMNYSDLESCFNEKYSKAFALYNNPHKKHISIFIALLDENQDLPPAVSECLFK